MDAEDGEILGHHVCCLFSLASGMHRIDDMVKIGRRIRGCGGHDGYVQFGKWCAD